MVVAGGLGLAPLRPVVHELIAGRDRYRRVAVLYGGRSPSELLYRDELDEWRRAAARGRADRRRTGRGLGVGSRVVTRLIRRARSLRANTLAMACGPEVMMRFVATALRERGVAGADIWLSLERSMKCATGHCGHCQLGPLFVCKDGPVMRHDRVEHLMGTPGL